MNHSSPSNSTASSPLAGKINRKQVAAYCGLCVRTIDELTRTGVLGHFRIGKSIRYDLAEVEATLREHFHVGGAGRAGCPQPAASKPKVTAKRKNPQDNLPPTIHQEPASNPPPFDIPHSGFVIPNSTATTQPSA